MQTGSQFSASSPFPPILSVPRSVSPVDTRRPQYAMQRPQTPPPSNPDTPNYWRYTKPVRVHQYLNQLLVPPSGYQSFSECLYSKYTELKVPKDKLDQFLNGWVFFNHFIRCEEKISIELVAEAWSRGVGIMCKPNTTSINFVIPVMLAQSADETNLGPMFDDWTRAELDEGCRHYSAIFINSKNFHDPVDHDTDALNMAVKAANFKDKSRFDKSGNIYLSFLQQFGPEGGNGRVTFPRIRGETDRTQIAVVLNGYGQETYKCLIDLPPNHPQFQSRKLTQEAIRQLKQRVEFGGKKSEDDIERVTLEEGFFGTRTMKEKWHDHWRGIEQNMQICRTIRGYRDA